MRILTFIQRQKSEKDFEQSGMISLMFLKDLANVENSWIKVEAGRLVKKTMK